MPPYREREKKKIIKEKKIEEARKKGGVKQKKVRGYKRKRLIYRKGI